MRAIAIAAVCVLGFWSREARASFGASAVVNLEVSDFRVRDLGDGIFHPGYSATVTWSGSCVSGDQVKHDGYLEGTGPVSRHMGEMMPAGVLSGGGSFTEENIDPGQVLVARAMAECNDGGGNEFHNDKTSPVVLAPYVANGPSAIMTSSPPEFFNCYPVGTEARVLPTFINTLSADEEIELNFEGPGIDFKKRFASSGELEQTPIMLKATGKGEVKFWVRKLGAFEGTPIDASSNVFTLEADTHAKCSTKYQPEDEDEEEDEQSLDDDGEGAGESDEADAASDSFFGCSSAGGASSSFAWMLFLASSAFVARRRR